MGPGSEESAVRQQHLQDVAAEMLHHLKGSFSQFLPAEDFPTPLYCHSHKWGSGLVAEPLGFPEDCVSFEDWHFWTQFCNLGVTF